MQPERGPAGAEGQIQGEVTLVSPHVFQGDEDDYEPSWTWDALSGGALAKGTPTAGIPGPTLTTGTTRSPGHPSPVPRVRGDTGEARGWGDRTKMFVW